MRFVDCEKRAWKHQGHGTLNIINCTVERTKPVTYIGVGGGQPLAGSSQNGITRIRGITLLLRDAEYGGVSIRAAEGARLVDVRDITHIVGRGVGGRI